MYRLPCTFSFALVLSVNVFVVAQEARREFSLLDVASPASSGIDKQSKLEFTFLEEILPSRQTLTPEQNSNLEAGLGFIDFDQVFTALPNGEPSPAEPSATSEPASPVQPAPVAVARIPLNSSSLAQVPVLTHVTAIEIATAAVAAPSDAPVAVEFPATDTAPSIGSGVEDLAGIQMFERVALEEATDVSHVEAIPEMLAVDDNYAEPVVRCDSCKSTMGCECKPQSSKWSCLTDWWHGSSLHRHHVHGIGQPPLFCERPFGICNEGFTGAMITSGKADRAMLHHYDFARNINGEVGLTLRGEREISRIAGIMAEYPVALKIESTFDPAQDTARRNAVVTAIAKMGLPISPDSVFVCEDRTIGLSGEDARAIHSIRINEVLTGASRTRIFSESGGAVVIPYVTGDGAAE